MTAPSPLVGAYLADLDRALAGAEPADRLEIVDAVREHIDTAVAELGAAPTQAEIAGVLRRLGTADDVAAAWAAGADRPTPGPGWVGPDPLLRPSAHGLVPVPPGETRPATSPWLVALVVILGLAVLGPALLALAVILWPAAIAIALGATVALGIAWRRATTHRAAWLAAFAACAVLTLALVVGVGGLVAFRSVGQSGGAVQVDVVPAPSPSP